MYPSETLARERSTDLHKQAQQTRIARHAAELRRLERIRQRTERKLLRARQRAEELRTMIEMAG